MTDLPAQFLRRVDESPDSDFYRLPRFVNHIDDATIAALTRFYSDFLPQGCRILDLMSSWVSHLPELAFGNVAGLGMNAEELAANPRLDEFIVHDLNTQPDLPYPPARFDRVLIAVSIQYLVAPVAVLRSAREVLDAEGRIAIAMSHRLFPTKAIAAFTRLNPSQRIDLVRHYLQQAGYTDIEFQDCSPVAADPLWMVTASA